MSDGAVCSHVLLRMPATANLIDRFDRKRIWGRWIGPGRALFAARPPALAGAERYPGCVLVLTWRCGAVWAARRGAFNWAVRCKAPAYRADRSRVITCQAICRHSHVP